VPVPSPLVVEHRLHSLSCSNCGYATRAVLADPVNAVGFGPGVEAVVATLWSACRLSHRMIVDTMRDLFGVRMAVGTVSNILDRVGCHVEAPVEQARAHVKEAEEPKNVDETGWYNRGADGSNPTGRRAWLWVAATAAVVAFQVALSRSQTVAKNLLGAVVRGTVITDRYLGYGFVDLERRQLCRAHLYRDFVRISERKGESGTVGRQLVRTTEKLFRLWGRYREGRLGQEIWESETAALRFRMRGLLERASGFETRRDERSERTRTKNTCREMLEVEPAMWLFVSRPEVGMTNNYAERQLRHAVLWRRASFGSQSARGAELVALLLTVVMTRRAQGTSVHEFLLEACRAAREGRQAPALVDPSA
jgi:transposase